MRVALRAFVLLILGISAVSQAALTFTCNCAGSCYDTHSLVAIQFQARPCPTSPTAAQEDALELLCPGGQVHMVTCGAGRAPEGAQTPSNTTIASPVSSTYSPPSSMLPY